MNQGLTESEARHKKAWEIWGKLKPIGQPLFSSAGPRRPGSVVAEKLGIASNILQDIPKEHQSCGKVAKSPIKANATTRVYWEQQAKLNHLPTMLKTIPPQKRAPAAKSKFRRTSCLGGDLYREQVFQERCLQSRDSRRNEMKNTLRNRVGKLDIASAFRTWDVDGDGTLSKSELWTGLDKLGLSLLKPDFVELFASIDLNGNGLIEIDELELFMGKCRIERGENIDNRFAFGQHLIEQRKLGDQIEADRKYEALHFAKKVRQMKEQRSRKNNVAAVKIWVGGAKKNPTELAKERVQTFLVARTIQYEQKANREKREKVLAKRKNIMASYMTSLKKGQDAVDADLGGVGNWCAPSR
jgi:hypothetical protein